MLTVYEQLFLLALDEEKGNFLPFAKKSIPFGLAGSILAELALLGVICINEKQRLEVSKTAVEIDDLLGEVVHDIQSAEKLRKASYWITLLTERPKKLRLRLGESMAAKKMIDQDENRFYWPGHATETPLLTKYQMKRPLRGAILGNEEIEPRGLALLNVAHACGLLGLIFTEDELPLAKRLIHEKVINAALKDASFQAIEEIGYAVVAGMEDASE